MNQLKEIADRIKELREILDMSEKEVADVVGIDIEQYLKYENAQDDIPVSILYGVAAALGTDTTVLLTGDMPRMAGYTVVRSGKGAEVERNPDYKFASLAFNFIGREMEPMIVTLDEADKIPELVFHAGQEFNYVVEGSVKVTIGKNVFVLNEGDSVYFDAMLPHSQQSVKGVSKFVTVINENAKGMKR